ncbi:MAG: hypothetical protein A2Z20_04270 [Bdellovibrionales bacterium RBG_16_40_8]|nr:MAG: hypothetical protein A2Z20_04270 [Bdellovibrionales bacterium RBG_16_40_8]
MYLEILSYIEDKSSRINDLKNIFYTTARVPLHTDELRQSLFQKYAAPYIEHWPDDVFFACDLNSKKTLGYLIGCRNSIAAESIFSPLLGSYVLFSDLFKKFPAHLHMNTHPDHQGVGVGTFLIEEYALELKKFGIKGVHVVTSPEERNVQFYLRHKFKHLYERKYNDRSLLFMGRRL